MVQHGDKEAGLIEMPMFDFICKACGMPGRAWRSEENGPPKFCSRQCKAEGMRGRKTKSKYPVTPEMHEEIRRIYQREPVSNQINDLAKRLRIPRWKITRYASHQGWIAKQKKQAPWTEAETEQLQRLARYAPEVVSRKMKAAGYHRSTTACVLKMRRLHMSQNLHGQSACSLAMCLGEDVKFVTRAIKSGALRAKKRGTARTEQQGGDMYYILDKDTKNFIVENVAIIDFRKVDKYWLVDLLAA